MLRCETVQVYYGEIEALRGVDLLVEKGEMVALLGANGAGKSTLLRTISGLNRPRRGEMYFNNRPLSPVSVEQRVKMGIAHVPEGRRVFPGLTVLENLTVAASSWSSRGRQFEGELELVFELFPRLRERSSQLGWSLSGGEQQMLAIGRALMARPQLLLLDEPSLGLAPILAEEVFDRINSINQKGVTVLLVEQNTVLALQVARRAYVLENGKIALEGSSKELARDDRVRRAYLGA